MVVRDDRLVAFSASGFTSRHDVDQVIEHEQHVHRGQVEHVVRHLAIAQHIVGPFLGSVPVDDPQGVIVLLVCVKRNDDAAVRRPRVARRDPHVDQGPHLHNAFADLVASP